MSKILVLGGGIVGLSTAMMLARRGHDVTVFERDSKPLPASPGDAWQAWERRGVAQFRQPHYLHPPAIELLDSHLPDVKQALIHAGCITFDALAMTPPTIADRTRREGDERFTTITGRRPTVEYAVASVAEKLIPIRRGVAVVPGRLLSVSADRSPWIRLAFTLPPDDMTTAIKTLATV